MILNPHLELQTRVPDTSSYAVSGLKRWLNLNSVLLLSSRLFCTCRHMLHGVMRILTWIPLTQLRLQLGSTTVSFHRDREARLMSVTVEYWDTYRWDFKNESWRGGRIRLKIIRLHSNGLTHLTNSIKNVFYMLLDSCIYFYFSLPSVLVILTTVLTERGWCHR